MRGNIRKGFGGFLVDKSKLVDWSCRTDFIVQDGKRGTFSQIYQKYSNGRWLAKCDELVAQRQVLCTPFDKLSSKVNINHLESAKSIEKSLAGRMTCLSLLDEIKVNQCLVKVEKISYKSNNVNGEVVKKAFCNFNLNFYSTDFFNDIAKCLKESGYTEAYIFDCFKEKEHTINSLNEKVNCTFPIFSKPAEECFKKSTNQIITSERQLIEWKEKTPDSHYRKIS